MVLTHYFASEKNFHGYPYPFHSRYFCRLILLWKRCCIDSYLIHRLVVTPAIERPTYNIILYGNPLLLRFIGSIFSRNKNQHRPFKLYLFLSFLKRYQRIVLYFGYIQAPLCASYSKLLFSCHSRFFNSTNLNATRQLLLSI